MQTKTKSINKQRGGYSDIRMWPCYVGYFGLVLVLAPHIGLWAALILLSIPATIVALAAASYQKSLLPTLIYDISAYKKSLVHSQIKRQQAPRVADFMHTIPASAQPISSQIRSATQTLVEASRLSIKKAQHFTAKVG